MTLEDETDADLVLRARGGEDRAFTTLMRRHKPSLYGFVRRYVGDADAAVDVVQETLVAAWKALARFDDRRAFPVWLRAIALNKCRDRARRLAVRRFILGEKDPNCTVATLKSVISNFKGECKTAFFPGADANFSNCRQDVLDKITSWLVFETS